MALPGLSLWLATPDGDDTHLHRPGDDPALATLPLPAPPAGLLAVVAPDASGAAVLLDARGFDVPEELAPDSFAVLNELLPAGPRRPRP